MRRKVCLTVFVIIAILVVAACGRSRESAPEPTEAPAAQAAPAEAAAEEADPTPTQASAEAWVVEEAESEAHSGTMMGDMVDPSAVEGDIILAGSSTVFPLAEAMLERFVDEGYLDNITYDSIGSGGGFERFCVTGETDIAGASRPIKDAEVESCAAIDRTPIEFRVGTDALAVVVHPDNDWATDVTMEEVAGLFTADNWSDVRADWPAEPILRFIPGTDSGTFDYFIEEVFDKDAGPILEASNTQLSEDDNVLVQGIQGSANAVGFFGFAYYSENQDGLGIVSIDGVEANAANVDNDSYPLGRPLYIYSDAGIITEKPQVGQFVNYFLTFVNEEVEEVGYFPAAPEVLAAAEGALMSAMGLEASASTDAGTGSAMLDDVDPQMVEGDIILAGSSTVFPLAEAMLERFVDEGYLDNITYDSIGSGGGFERFCVTGETDIAGASRPIKDAEVESCAAIDRTPIEFRVGTDALAVVVHPDNDWATDVTMEEVAGLFTADNWSDVRADWPAEPILRFIPGTDSGTFDYFIEEVFDKDAGPILEASNTQLSEDDNVLVQGIQGSANAVGFFGFAYYSENQDGLGIVSIDGVEANAANVDNDSYPLGRPLYIYSDAGIITEKPQVGQFVSYFLTFVNEEVEEVGYFPAAPDVLDDAKSALLEAMQ